MQTTFATIADKIIEEGTRTHTAVLEAMASLARSSAPGASAALVDWDGAEVVRLRAFDHVVRAILGDRPEFDVGDLLRSTTPAYAA